MIIAVAGVVVYQMMQAPVKVLPSGQASPTAAASPQDAASFDRKVEAVRTQVAAGGAQPVHLALSEQELTAKVQASLGNSGSQALRDVSVSLGDGVVTLHGTASFNGMAVPIEATASVAANNGYLAIDLTSVSAAGFGVPSGLERQLTDQISQGSGLSDLQKIDLGIDVQQVQISGGQLVIDGRTR